MGGPASPTSGAAGQRQLHPAELWHPSRIGVSGRTVRARRGIPGLVLGAFGIDQRSHHNVRGTGATYPIASGVLSVEVHSRGQWEPLASTV